MVWNSVRFTLRGAVEPVEVGVGWTVDVQVAAADVEDGLVIHHESTVRVLEGGVGGQDGVLGLHDGGGDLGRRVDSKLQLGLLAVVHGQTLHEEGGEAGVSAAVKEWKMRKPWRPVHWSASFLTRSRTRSTISLPMVQRSQT